jgi:hypothetical protein
MNYAAVKVNVHVQCDGVLLEAARSTEGQGAVTVLSASQFI